MDKEFEKSSRKIYILSGNSYDGIKDIRGDYIAVDDTGKVIGHKVCSAKKYARFDLFYKNNLIKHLPQKYGNDFQILYLGEDNMTLERLVELYNKNWKEK